MNCSLDMYNVGHNQPVLCCAMFSNEIHCQPKAPWKERNKTLIKLAIYYSDSNDYRIRNVNVRSDENQLDKVQLI